MSDEAEDVDGEGEDPGADGKKKVSGKKLVLFVVLPLLLLGGGAAAVFMLGLLDPLLGIEQVEEGQEGDAEEGAEEPVVRPPGVFYELDEITVTLSGTSNRRNFLVLEIQLELEDASAIPILEQLRPKIISEFNIFLRELRVEELNGSEGTYLVREELYRRISSVVAPTPVRDLLIVKMLVQ